MQISPIREARQRARLTQIELCVRADVCPRTLQLVERWGAAAISRESLRKIVTALGIPEDELRVQS